MWLARGRGRSCGHLLAILAMASSKEQGRKYDQEPLTVGMLERAIKLGVWDSRKLTSRLEII
jgi:hypothetical protein